MPTVASGLAPDFLYCVFNTSPEHSITGIPRSATLLHLGERSFCSKAQVSDGPQVRCLTRSPAWQACIGFLGRAWCQILRCPTPALARSQHWLGHSPFLPRAGCLIVTKHRQTITVTYGGTFKRKVRMHP
jgi:hypothetical protein